MNEKITMLNEAKRKLLEKNCQVFGHSRGMWSKEHIGKDSPISIIYSRSCTSCGNLMKIETSEPVIEIEEQIAKQNKGRQLLDYLSNTNENSLTKDNLLFYLFMVRDYIDFMDKNTLKEILIKHNNPDIESLNEFSLLKNFIDNIHDIDDNIWSDIANYISTNYQERNIKSF